MGNKGSTSRDQTDAVYASHSVQKKSNSEHNSLKSFLSVDSRQSTYSVSRPWSRVSRRRWQESTLTLPYASCKTAWPVSQSESLFLPDFPVKDYHKDNKYQKLPQISCGAFGKIYQVKDLDKNEIFALKVLSKSKIIENNLAKQVIEEVQIQRACGHYPFITKCLLNWQSRRHLYIATEFVEGGELWYLLDNLGALPVELVQLYVCQIALALDFLHNAGVIYRDLKPENVLLDGHADIKLIDFGLSKWLPLGRTTRTVCGTPKYMGLSVITCDKNEIIELLVKMNARSQVFELMLEGRQADEAVASIFHTVLFHRCLGKFSYSEESSYSVSTVGFTDVDCDFIDLTYVCCSSNTLNRKVKQEISNFSEQLRSNESSGVGQISLEFFQRKRSRYYILHPECLPWEVWTVRLQLIPLENEGQRQLCRERVGEHLTDKILYITEVMNRQDYLPKMPSRSEIDLVFDTGLPDVQPYLFKVNYSVSGPSSGTSVGSSMRKFIRESLNL